MEAPHNLSAVETLLALERHLTQRLYNLEQELACTQKNLQTAIEELETTNEQLQATSDTLLEAREELQTTKEELQSVYEELYMVTVECQNKMGALSQLHHDGDHLVRSADARMMHEDIPARRQVTGEEG